MRSSFALFLVAISVWRPGCNVVHAQIYTFENLGVPANRSLSTLYAFYVFSHAEAPERTAGQPFVKFHGLEAHSSSPTKKDNDLQAYSGLQLSIMKYRDFWNLIDPRKFCCDSADVSQGRCKAKDQLLVQKPVGKEASDVDVYLHTLKFGREAKDDRMSIMDTGVYILVFSNCGDFSTASVSGSVIVKNAYGFLPGNEYHKMPFYGWLLLLYMALAAVWSGLSMRWWKELFAIHNCIAAVIFFGLVEAFLWYVFYNDWNSSGTRGGFLFIIAILSSVMKSILSYMLVLVASLGWGVTRPYLDRQVILKIQVVCVLYIVLDFIRESVLSFRHSHSLSLAFVLLCLLPVSLLNGGIFYWIFTALSHLMETLRDRRQFDKLALFRNLWRILIFSLAVATVTLLFQIFDLSRSISTKWKYQWLFADGISHVLFVFILQVMMYLWSPHANSKRYSYHQAGDQEQDATGTADHADIWAEEDGHDDDGDDGESFWASTRQDAEAKKSTVAPAEVFGKLADAGTEKD